MLDQNTALIVVGPAEGLGGPDTPSQKFTPWATSWGERGALATPFP